MVILRRSHEVNPKARAFAVAGHDDEVEEHIEAGAEAAWYMYSKTGSALASEVISYYRNKETKNSWFASCWSGSGWWTSSTSGASIRSM